MDSSSPPRPIPPAVSGRDVTPLTESDEDSESSGSYTERRSAYYPSVTPANSDSIIHLPTRWNDQDKNKYLHISEDGRNLSFHGPTQQGEKEAAAARANHPIPPACGIYYYEVTILDKGYKGHISVGFSCSGVRLNRLPGWERNSWGYHGDDGNSFASERDGTPFGPKFTTGDVVGCGIDFSLGKAFYTKNSSLLVGYAFENIGRGEAIYPSVGLRTPQEQIRVNFGQEPFKYDIDYHVHLARDRAWSRIQATPAARKDSSAEVKQEPTDDDFTPISLAKDYSEPIDKLILSYLHHHGYENTASALKTQIDGRRKKAAMAGKLAVDSGSDVMRYRQRIVGAVFTGDIDLALQLIQEVCPSVLETDEGFLHLKLKCRKFVELILRASDALQAIKNAEAETTPILAESAGSMGEADMDVDEENDQSQTNGFSDGSAPVTKPVPLSPRMKRTSSRSVPPPVVAAYQSALSEALSYGKALHAEMPRADSMSGVGARPEAHALLKTTFSLVTYDDPRVAGGEVQALTSREARAKLAGDVNQAILESQGRPSRPALERMYRQTSVVLDDLARTGVGDAAFADMYSEFLDT
ncbi:SPRY-domain-containing protein [Fomitiporia mediterranea MF3/22]|uniref:SPRY-domain-containing protein n=1 Tax=Fomitiporia mediterranea (strain MF3/22) TaxID=694068 RepID=UPI0004407543|nr:SPRY-domain-containing protein [Fomitiporia mediterranea MF3/22]EJD04459.1 SPRY-domain-containing protein [Fomitiporia mediterranea MF3/22]